MSGPRPTLARQNRERSAAFRASSSRTAKSYSRCGETKSPDEFGFQAKTWDKRQNRCLSCARLVNRLYARERLAALRLEVFEKLGRACRRCGFDDVRALQIDHVYGDGRADNESHRGIRFYLKILADKTGAHQILCANCNWIKRHINSELPKRLQ